MLPKLALDSLCYPTSNLEQSSSLRTHCVLASASWVLGLQVCASMPCNPNQYFYFIFYFLIINLFICVWVCVRDVYVGGVSAHTCEGARPGCRVSCFIDI